MAVHRGLIALSIRQQLIVGVALVHALLMTLLVVNLVGNQSDFLYRQNQERTHRLAETLAVSSASWVMANDVVGLQEVVMSMARLPDVYYAMLLAPDGQVLAHSQPAHVGRYVQDSISRSLLAHAPALHTLLANDDLIDTAAPVMAGPRFLGWARISISQEQIAMNLRQVQIDGVLFTLIAIAIGSLFALLMANRLTYGLNRLVSAIAQVRIGQRGFRLDGKRQDEIGRISEGFNRMLAALEENEAERQQAAEALRVALTKYQTLFESFPLGITVSDAAGRILETNLMAEQLLGVSRTEHSQRAINGSEWRIVRPDGSSMPPVEYASVQALAENRLVKNVEMGVVKAQGATIWLSVTAAPLPLEGYGVVVAYSDITERRQVEDALRHSLVEKETLLREVHHRVKNNFAAIIGLLDLQRNLLANASTASLLIELSSQIKSMALVHEMLYRSGTLSRIDFHVYLQALIGYLRGAFDPHGAIRIKVAAADLWMNLDTAIPCGLIVNELVINALKYAFPCDGSNFKLNTRDISITATAKGANYTLIVADNGVGFPADLDWTTTKTLGLRLVRMLGQHQLQGKLELDRTAGTRVSLQFSAH